MKKQWILTFAGVLAGIVSATSAQAGNDVSFVEFGGADGGTCSNTSADRCKTLTRALTQTNAGGTIHCLNSDSHAALTITQSVTIDCAGTNTSIVAAGSAVTINGAAVIVRLRGLRISGGTGGNAGTAGINITNAAAVIIEDCTIADFTGSAAIGIKFTPTVSGSQLVVTNTSVYNSGVGTTGGGIVLKPASGVTAQVTLAAIMHHAELFLRRSGDACTSDPSAGSV